MTQDEIIRMAREAGLIGEGEPDNPIEELMRDALIKMLPRFASLVAANLFTYDQVKAHIQAAVITEREACAKVCDEIEQDRWNLYKGRPPYTGSEFGRADPHEQGVSMGAGECAAAIRARGEK